MKCSKKEGGEGYKASMLPQCAFNLISISVEKFILRAHFIMTLKCALHELSIVSKLPQPNKVILLVAIVHTAMIKFIVMGVKKRKECS